MTAPRIEDFHGATNVVLFSPHFAPHPVFHLLGHHFGPDVNETQRDRLEVPPGFDVTTVSTLCGTIIRATWWMEPRDRGVAKFSDTYSHPFTVVELRLDQAAAFGKPCRRCFTVPAL